MLDFDRGWLAALHRSPMVLEAPVLDHDPQRFASPSLADGYLRFLWRPACFTTRTQATGPEDVCW